MSNKPDGIFGLFDVVRDFYAHGIDEHPWVLFLVVIIFLDIAVGVARAWAAHELSSTKFRKGAVSHTAMIVFVAIFYPFANFMNLTSIVDTFIFAMIAAYGSSILASLSALGVKSLISISMLRGILTKRNSFLTQKKKRRIQKMINFKLRLQNKATLVALISTIFLMLQQFGLEIPRNIQEGVNTFVVILVILGIVTDPTTKGLGDSEQALGYHEPKQD